MPGLLNDKWRSQDQSNRRSLTGNLPNLLDVSAAAFAAQMLICTRFGLWAALRDRSCTTWSKESYSTPKWMPQDGKIAFCVWVFLQKWIVDSGIVVDLSLTLRVAFLPLLAAKKRLSVIAPLGFWSRKWLYNMRVNEAAQGVHEILRDLHVLTGLGIPTPETAPEIQLQAPSVAWASGPKLPPNFWLFHLSTSMQKKDWPLDKWSDLLQLLSEEQQQKIVLTSGPTFRSNCYGEDQRNRCLLARFRFHSF